MAESSRARDPLHHEVLLASGVVAGRGVAEGLHEQVEFIADRPGRSFAWDIVAASNSVPSGNEKCRMIETTFRIWSAPACHGSLSGSWEDDRS